MPRSGVDSEGNPFTDVAGDLIDELFWLRSWTNETYLWNDEVVDRDPYDFSDRLAYFDVLRTTELTSSGVPKDNFHFSQPTDEFLEQRNATPTSGYGARLLAFSTTPPRDFRIAYVEPNSPAAQSGGFVRGDRILQIDGVDLVNANSDSELNILNGGLFPAVAGETHQFVVEEPGGATRNITLTSADVASKPVNRFSTIDTPTGKVGYILMNSFSSFQSEADIVEAINAIRAEGVNDLVLDLRYNGGGLLAVAAQLGYMVAGDARTNGRVFEGLRFNADAMGVNPVTGESDNDIPFYSTGLGFTVPSGQALQTLNLPRVFVLTTDGTCSASESVINSLRGINVEVILIGSRTCGKPFGFYPTDNCGETYYTIQFQGVNDVGFGDYADGFIANNSASSFGVRAPGCAVGDDLANALGDPAEGLLAAALDYRETGTCPTPTATSGIVANAAIVPPVNPAPQRDVFETNRDLTLPGDE